MFKTAICGWPARGSSSRITQTLLVMKLTVIMLTACFMNVSAAGFSQKVSFSGKNVSLEKVFQSVTSQTGYNFFYDIALVKSVHPVSINVKDQPLEQFLKTLTRNLPVTYTIENKNVIIHAAATADRPAATVSAIQLYADSSITVSGRVVDDKGVPLVGATVRVKGTEKASTSDANGNFTLKNVYSSDILELSYVGYETRVLKVGKKEDLGIIAIKPSITNMENVEVTVNTGYQTLPKERSAGSFATANTSVLKDRNASTNILDQLDGLIPGLTVNQAPGAQKLLIRGLNSIQGNKNPLIVVDGISVEDISAINAQDVENITVLKDATAAAIWGARAANGVIVITTRKGKKDSRLQVEYSGIYTNHGRPDYDYHNYMNSQEFVRTAKELFDPVLNTWSNMSIGYFIMPHELIMYNEYRGLIDAAQAQAGLDSLSNINNRSQIDKYWVRNAITNNQTISLRGGGKVHSYYGSLNYINAQSNTYGENSHQYKANLRQDFNLGKRLQVHLITDLTAGNNTAKRPLSVGADYLPYQLFAGPDGEALDLNYMKFPTDALRQQRESETQMDLTYYPLLEMHRGETKGSKLLARMVGGINLELFKGLKFEGLYGYVHGNNRKEDDEFEDSYTTRYKVATLTAPPSSPGGDLVRYIPKDGGIHTVSNGNTRQWTVRNQLSYDFSRGDHRFNIVGGQEAQELYAFSDRSRVYGYNRSMMTYSNLAYDRLMDGNVIPGGYFGTMQLGGDDAIYQQTDVKTRFSSYYGLGSYAYKGKYIFNASWRIDESNLFGKDKAAQSRPVWSMGGKWRLGEEAFLLNNRLLRGLDLRATYGITGNSPLPGSAASFDIISSIVTPLEGGGTTLYVSVPGNPGLSWESTKVINLGVDFTLANNRLSGSIDYYSKHTTGLIGSYHLNMLTGHTSTTGNLGDLKNRGIELSLNSINVQTPDFKWTTSVNMSYNKNEITDLGETSVPTINSIYLKGRPAFAVLAYNYAGLDGNGNPKIQLADKSVTSARQTTYLEDWKFMGTTQPVWNGGLFNNFSYRQFAFNVNMVFNLGHVMRRDIQYQFTGGRMTANMSREFFDRWQPGMDSTSTNIPGYIANSSLNNSQRNINYYTQADINTISASFVKIRDIGLSYTIPNTVLQRTGISNLSVRVQMHNMLLWANNDYGIDPEFRGNTPYNQKSFSIGLRAQF